MHNKENNVAKLNAIKYVEDTKAVKTIIDIKNAPPVKESRVNLIPAVVAQ